MKKEHVKLTEENASEFVGKWCLYRLENSYHYARVFISAVKDGLVEYRSETDYTIRMFADIEYFASRPLIVSPFERVTEQQCGADGSSK